MIETLLAGILVFGLSVVGLSVGVLFSRKTRLQKRCHADRGTEGNDGDACRCHKDGQGNSGDVKTDALLGEGVTFEPVAPGSHLEDRLRNQRSPH